MYLLPFLESGRYLAPSNPGTPIFNPCFELGWSDLERAPDVTFTRDRRSWCPVPEDGWEVATWILAWHIVDDPSAAADAVALMKLAKAEHPGEEQHALTSIWLLLLDY